MTVKKTTAKAVREDSAPRYTLDELKEKAEQLFSVKEEVLAGAFYGSGQTVCSVEEAKAKINEFMKAKVE